MIALGFMGFIIIAATRLCCYINYSQKNTAHASNKLNLSSPVAAASRSSAKKKRKQRLIRKFKIADCHWKVQFP